MLLMFLFDILVSALALGCHGLTAWGVLTRVDTHTHTHTEQLHPLKHNHIEIKGGADVAKVGGEGNIGCQAVNDSVDVLCVCVCV